MRPFPSSRAGQIHQREQEIAELKQKIAEVMAVMPSLSYSSDGSNLSPVTPHYSSKFMDNSPSSLDPNASVYQPLKKWLWHPHCCQTEHCLFHWSSLFQVFFSFFSWTAPESFFTLKSTTQSNTQCTQSLHTYVCLAPVWVLFRDFFFFFFFQGVVLCFCYVFGFYLLDCAISWRVGKKTTHKLRVKCLPEEPSPHVDYFWCRPAPSRPYFLRRRRDTLSFCLFHFSVK